MVAWSMSGYSIENAHFAKMHVRMNSRHFAILTIHKSRQASTQPIFIQLYITGIHQTSLQHRSCLSKPCQTQKTVHTSAGHWADMPLPCQLQLALVTCLLACLSLLVWFHDPETPYMYNCIFAIEASITCTHCTWSLFDLSLYHALHLDTLAHSAGEPTICHGHKGS